MSSVQNTKARHYAALAARLNTLKTNLDETERLMDDMAGHLLAMRDLAASHASQFMAMSRLVDLELIEHQEREARAAAGTDAAGTAAADESRSSKHARDGHDGRDGRDASRRQEHAQDEEQDGDVSYRTATP